MLPPHLTWEVMKDRGRALMPGRSRSPLTRQPSIPSQDASRLTTSSCTTARLISPSSATSLLWSLLSHSPSCTTYIGRASRMPYFLASTRSLACSKSFSTIHCLHERSLCIFYLFPKLPTSPHRSRTCQSRIQQVCAFAAPNASNTLNPDIASVLCVSFLLVYVMSILVLSASALVRM